MIEREKLICKICKKQDLIKFISFGKMPAANAFLTKEDLNKEEYFYNMEVGFCENCKMVQMINIVPYEKYIVPNEKGKTQYAFFSSTSNYMQQHFAKLAKEVEERFLEENSKVMEIGSNDGIMLQAFKKNKVLGIEPSHNVADAAISKGIETLKTFFTLELAKKIVDEKGKFKSILSTNVTLNIIDIHSFMEGINVLLENKGVFITEDPYIAEILDKNSYDQIYDEHIWFFSLMSMSYLARVHGLDIFDAERLEVHGGSMRIYLCKEGAYKKTERLLNYLKIEEEKKIGQIYPYLKFKEDVESNKEKLKKLLVELKSEGKKIVGYAAASKGTIVLNYCDIGKDIIDYISDSTPAKQGTFSPGKHIPIVTPEYFHQDKVDYALLGAWNHAKEILNKEKDFLKRGGKFIIHLPTPRIISSINELEQERNIEIKKLNIFANDQGYLFETLRKDDSLFDGEFGQVLVSVIYPGVIKGLHKHEKQTDYTTCLKGNIKYIVVKENIDGTSEVKTYIIGEKNPILIKVPPGYWHGYTPLSNQESIVLHLMDKVYNPKEDDTQRRDPFYFGDVWKVKNN